jgi:hypothetical protein
MRRFFLILFLILGARTASAQLSLLYTHESRPTYFEMSGSKLMRGEYTYIGIFDPISTNYLWKKSFPNSSIYAAGSTAGHEVAGIIYSPGTLQTYSLFMLNSAGGTRWLVPFPLTRPWSGADVAIDGASNVVVRTRAGELFKFDSNGALLFRLDQIGVFTLGPTGDLFSAGGPETNRIFRIDAVGGPVWEHLSDSVSQMQTDGAGNLICHEFRFLGGARLDQYLEKFSPGGTPFWKTRVAEQTSIYVNAPLRLLVSPAGHMFVGVGDNSAGLIKVGSSGEIQWLSFLPYFIGNPIFCASDGGVLVSYNSSAASLDSNGVMRWISDVPTQFYPLDARSDGTRLFARDTTLSVFGISHPTGLPTISNRMRDFITETNSIVPLEVSSEGTGPFTYQWFSAPLFPAEIPGATNATHSWSLPREPGYQPPVFWYWVEISNSFGKVRSPVGTVTVKIPPIVEDTSTNSFALLKGQTINLSAPRSYQSPIYHQWKINGHAFPITNDARLILTNLEATMSGPIELTITNIGGAVTLDLGVLTVSEGAYFLWDHALPGGPLRLVDDGKDGCVVQRSLFKKELHCDHYKGTGELLWSRMIFRTTNSLTALLDPIRDTNGFYYICALERDSNEAPLPDHPVHLFKLNAGGELIWRHRLTFSGYPFAMRLDTDGNVIFGAGFEFTVTSPAGEFIRRGYLRRGMLQMAIDPSNNLLFRGYTEPGSYLEKYSPSGVFLWSWQGVEGYAFRGGIVSLPDGRIASDFLEGVICLSPNGIPLWTNATSTAGASPSGDVFAFKGSDIAKISPDGQVIWAKPFVVNSYWVRGNPAADGGIYINSFNRYTADGDLKWRLTFPPVPADTGLADPIVAGPEGFVQLSYIGTNGFHVVGLFEPKHSGEPYVGTIVGSGAAILGSPLMLSAPSISGPATTNQWFHNGTPLLNQTNLQLSLPNIFRESAGEYSLVVSNQAGATISRIQITPYAGVLSTAPAPGSGPVRFTLESHSPTNILEFSTNLIHWSSAGEFGPGASSFTNNGVAPKAFYRFRTP